MTWALRNMKSFLCLLFVHIVIFRHRRQSLPIFVMFTLCCHQYVSSVPFFWKKVQKWPDPHRRTAGGSCRCNRALVVLGFIERIEAFVTEWRSYKKSKDIWTLMVLCILSSSLSLLQRNCIRCFHCWPNMLGKMYQDSCANIRPTHIQGRSSNVACCSSRTRLINREREGRDPECAFKFRNRLRLSACITLMHLAYPSFVFLCVQLSYS